MLGSGHDDEIKHHMRTCHVIFTSKIIISIIICTIVLKACMYTLDTSGMNIILSSYIIIIIIIYNLYI